MKAFADAGEAGEWLKGRFGCNPTPTYGDVELILGERGYTCSGFGGSYRSWKHPQHRDVLTVRDEGAGRPMRSRYIKKTAEHLHAVCQAEVDDVPNDAR